MSMGHKILKKAIKYIYIIFPEKLILAQISPHFFHSILYQYKP